MLRETISDFASEAGDILAGFFGRNAVVLVALSIFALVSLAR